MLSRGFCFVRGMGAYILPSRSPTVGLVLLVSDLSRRACHDILRALDCSKLSLRLVKIHGMQPM